MIFVNSGGYKLVAQYSYDYINRSGIGLLEK